jgi:hypothetical protein
MGNRVKVSLEVVTCNNAFKCECMKILALHKFLNTKHQVLDGKKNRWNIKWM